MSDPNAKQSSLTSRRARRDRPMSWLWPHFRLRPQRRPLLALLLAAALTSGCSAVHTSVKKSDLDVQTRMSDTVFLEPVAAEQRVIFVSVRNTSDKQLGLKPQVIQRLQDSGYVVTDDPQRAQYMLLANVLKVGRDDLRASDSYLEAGVSGAVVGGVASGRSDTAKGAVLGAVIGLVGDALVDDVLFTMVTDLEVRERPRPGEVVTRSEAGESQHGSDAAALQTVDPLRADWKRYRTRVVSTANKVNLEFEEALPALESGLVRAISGMFAE